MGWILPSWRQSGPEGAQLSAASPRSELCTSKPEGWPTRPLLPGGGSAVTVARTLELGNRAARRTNGFKLAVVKTDRSVNPRWPDECGREQRREPEQQPQRALGVPAQEEEHGGGQPVVPWITIPVSHWEMTLKNHGKRAENEAWSTTFSLLLPAEPR